MFHCSLHMEWNTSIRNVLLCPSRPYMYTNNWLYSVSRLKNTGNFLATLYLYKNINSVCLLDAGWKSFPGSNYICIQGSYSRVLRIIRDTYMCKCLFWLINTKWQIYGRRAWPRKVVVNMVLINWHSAVFVWIKTWNCLKLKMTEEILPCTKWSNILTTQTTIWKRTYMCNRHIRK